MKLFQNTLRKSKPEPDAFDVQSAPVRTDPLAGTASAQIKVDLAVQIGNNLVVAGWRSKQMDVWIVVNGLCEGARQITIDRPDVNAHFELSADERCGFVLISQVFLKNQTAQEICLGWTGIDNQSRISKQLRLQNSTSLTPGDRAVLGRAIFNLSNQLSLNSPEWKQLVAKAPPTSETCVSVRGFLEGAAVCDTTGDAVVVGWVVQAAGTTVWLEDQSGQAYPLDVAFRQFIEDVHVAVVNEFVHGSLNAGFVLHLNGLKASGSLRLRAATETGLHTLSDIACVALPIDPVGAAQWLFAIRTPLSDLHSRIPLVDQPVLSALIEHRLSIWGELPVLQRTLGTPPLAPSVSIVIPLFGRTDFVEHQMLEFTKDTWLQNNAEIIYVVDDPRIVDSFNTQAEALFRLYRLPFQWLWGNVNRGFSGANNLGAKHARGQHLVFLNSDAFPQQPGWVQAMVQALDQHPEIGAVGARLLFGDGGIQHAGMQFLRREELGIWVNHHPRMGLDPSLDLHKELTVVPAVTGACMALRRCDFDRIGGWDTGYLIGDFEDSDLCFKLRAAGQQIGYLPHVELTHLERQSFKLLGQDEFRQRVVVYNAVRHQSRWSSLIEQPVESVSLFEQRKT